MAYPDIEPWGSFSIQYRRAEHGLEGAASGTITLVVQELWKLAKRASQGDREAALALAKNNNLKELLNVLAQRFPEDWGQSQWRKPESAHDASNYLEAHVMEREQLAALFSDPPEPVRLALGDSGWVQMLVPLKAEAI
jgi:hypothetical protein